LIAQAGGRQDEQALARLSVQQFRSDECSLNRLSQADFIGKQQSCGPAAHNRECRLQLMGQQIDVCGASGAKRTGGSRSGDQRSADSTPHPRPNETHCRRRKRFDAIKRRKHPALDAAIRRRSAAQCDDVAQIISTNVDDAPPGAADENEIASTKDLHRESPARSQQFAGDRSAAPPVNELGSARRAW
jgi:hypothetical protein